MTASLCFVLYPSASNAVNSFFAASTINNYAANLDSISAADRSQYLSAAAEYNNNLSELVNGFTYDVDSVIDGYDDILNFGDGLIGYIDISKINVKLPIYHGDEDKVLEKGVAHLPNTAFPIGGVGNHSVLSAHTGYPTQVFFDNLNELEIGDEIKVSVLDETLTYAVTAKNIVKPDNILLLSVDEEKDLLSLITCYPYGVNSHRLIVTAERVSETASPDTAIKAETNNRSFDFILLAIIAIAITAVIATFAVRKRRKNETVRGSELYINHYDPVKEKENTESKNFDTINEKKSKSVGVKEENLQSVPTEPIVTETSKDTEFSIPIFATLYDKCNRKIDELNSKNDKFNAKIEKLNIKKSRNAEFVSTIESLKDIVPKPVYTALSLLATERRQKIVSINEKISAHKLNIKSNENKIQKHQSRADFCIKIHKFLDNMKSPDGRKENFVKGIQEYRMMSMRTTSEKFDATQNKLDSALKAYSQTHYMSEKLKLQKQINKLTTKKEKLMRKLKALDEWSVKFDAVKAMPDKEADNIINKSCQNIVDEFTTNPQALKKQADTIVSSTAKVIFEENYLKNAEMSIEDDYDSIDGIINNGNKQQEYEKLKEPDKKSERRTAPLSRNQIKQNANTIAHNEQRTNDKTKTQGQEL